MGGGDLFVHTAAANPIIQRFINLLMYQDLSPSTDENEAWLTLAPISFDVSACLAYQTDVE